MTISPLSSLADGSQIKARDHADLVSTCLLIRAFEERLLDLFSAGEIDGTTHTSIGQEVNAVGILAHCSDDDVVVSNHRCHAHFIARTGDTRPLLAEIMGLRSGVCRGVGGSQHLCVPGKFYSNGIQGGIAPFGVGLARAKQLRKEPGLVIVFIGDGTLGEGVLYEALNIAKLSAAPVLFVLEDNGIAQTTPSEWTLSGDVAKRFEAFGLPVTRLFYPSLGQIHESAEKAICALRAGGGPQVMVIRNPRLGPHSKGDDTRSAEVLAAERARDPFGGFAGDIGDEALEALRQTALARLSEEYETLRQERAQQAPVELPLLQEDAAPASYVGKAVVPLRTIDGVRFNERLRAGLAELLQRDPFAVLMGEDIAAPYGGAFKVSGDLSARFPDRVWPMPISEAAMVGVAGGLSVGGCLPIVEIMFGDFATLTVDQLVNHFAKFRQMYAGQVATPGIVRLPMGGRRGYGPTHSQSLEKMLLGLPGLRVVAPSVLHPVGDMLAACAAELYPTAFIENKLDYARASSVADGRYRGFMARQRGRAMAPTIALSLTDFADDQFSLYAYGGMLTIALDALEELAVEHEICGRLVCPSLLSPHPAQDLWSEQVGSFALVIEEGVSEFGWSAEVACALNEMQGSLSVQRIGAERHCIPAATRQEKAVLPDAAEIVARVLDHFERKAL